MRTPRGRCCRRLCERLRTRAETKKPRNGGSFVWAFDSLARVQADLGARLYEIVPPASSFHRLESVFILVRGSTLPLEELVHGDALRRLRFPLRIAAALLLALRELGVSRASLFPAPPDPVG